MSPLVTMASEPGESGRTGLCPADMIGAKSPSSGRTLLKWDIKASSASPEATTAPPRWTFKPDSASLLASRVTSQHLYQGPSWRFKTANAASHGNVSSSNVCSPAVSLSMIDSTV